MIELVMPQLGESVAEGTVTKWRVQVGDFVKREQPIVEVATDKADTEIPSPADGRVVSIAAMAGALVAKGGLLCVIDEAAKEGAAAGAAVPAVAAEPEKSAPAAEPKPAVKDPLSSPSARRLALSSGIDLRDVPSSDKHGRISKGDVVRAKEASAQKAGAAGPAEPEPGTSVSASGSQAAELAELIQAGGGFVPPVPGVGFGAYKVPPFVPKPGDQVIPFNRRRQITADHMVYSKVSAPHVVTVAEVDLHATSKLREANKERLKKEGVSLTFLAFVCAAAIKSLREHPQLNARVLDRAFAVLSDINLGIAVDTQGGLLVPNIKKADQLSLRGIAKNIDELAARARSGKITADDLAGTTFTVSNPGLKGNLFGGAIISQPNVGILRMGEIKKRVVVVTSKDGEDSIAIHPVMFLALSYDHRVVDGVLANSFLWRIADLLSRGDFEV